jgi:hypothetical protein
MSRFFEPWTKESALRLGRMAAIGYTCEMAAQELGRTRSAIAGKAKRLGIAFKGGGACGHKQDLETRIKIGAGVRAARQKRASAQ